MATPQTMLGQEAAHEHALVTELLAALQTMDNKVWIDARFSEGIDGVSHKETS
jgi:hypothetical protein